MYTYLYRRSRRRAPEIRAQVGWHYLSNATLSNTASFVLCVFRGVKDHHNLQPYVPLLRKTCVRQVVSDKWLPLMTIANLATARPEGTAPKRSKTQTDESRAQLDECREHSRQKDPEL